MIASQFYVFLQRLVLSAHFQHGLIFKSAIKIVTNESIQQAKGVAIFGVGYDVYFCPLGTRCSAACISTYCAA